MRRGAHIMANEVKTTENNLTAIQAAKSPNGDVSESKVPQIAPETAETAQVNPSEGSLNEKGAAKKKSSKKKKASKKRKKKQAKRFFIKLFIVIAIVFALCYWVIGIIPQHGNQMFPSVKDGDLMITLKVGQPYQAGVVCAYKAPDGKMRIGRIVAMPGDKVSFTEKGALVLNDLEAMEEYIIPTSRTSQSKEESDALLEDEKEAKNDEGEIVPAGCYYILNDRRVEEDDSRTYGAIKEEDLRGTAFWQFRKREF